MCIILVHLTSESNNWQKDANKLGKQKCKELSVDFKETEVIATLPETCRALVKPAGYLSFGAHG